MLKTYDFQDQVRQLDAGIEMIINDAPTLLGLVGMNDEAIYNTKYEWMSDRLNSNLSSVSGAKTAGDTVIDLPATDGEKLRVNAIVVAGEEYMRVTAVNGDQITVARGFDGTTAADLADGAELRIVSRPQYEGENPGTDESHDRYVDYNYAQIIERYAAVSKTQQAVRTHNVSNELNYQVELRLQEATREFNDWLIYGRRMNTSGIPRTTGGLLYFANANGAKKENASSGELSASLLNGVMEAVYQRGGSVNTILTNTAGARQISKLAGDSIRTERQDTATGHRISTFVSDIVGGNVATVVVDPNFPKNKVALFDRNILSMHPLRPMYDEDATIPGADYVSRQIRGEYGIKVKNANEKIAIIENISTTVS
ncbi:DUF5309 domain-containing protein [Mechercharimyces sp. CAU 1602]|uniref:DUF5309 domain-containing protein n=1 Tax=Mechercharimyces sp. CAU 1602 TaxID=2973933 RepID=UPI002163F91C|nr:DUF5309 domain-containing protein [Mechercharimyces sp. CAU 1602]MCS1350316.1 DUF5309 domain-containing protein [Mechercharimyces sp. CAU 1602]